MMDYGLPDISEVGQKRFLAQLVDMTGTDALKEELVQVQRVLFLVADAVSAAEGKPFDLVAETRAKMQQGEV